MAIPNPFSITFDNFSVGGSSSTYQLLGPYGIAKGFASWRLDFNVLVVASSYGGLQSASEELETKFRTRLEDGDTIRISLGGSSWTYTVGSDLLHVESAIAKSANPDTDRGYSRSYTVSVTAELPADGAGDGGLRDIEVLVDYTPSRQATVTMRGVYTATSAGDAKARYDSSFDSIATNYLDAVDSSAVWELVDENFTFDREGSSGSPSPHLLSFARQYVQLIADQTTGIRDDESISDHRVTFTDLSQFPGDGRENVERLRRVVGSFDCAINVEQTDDPLSVYNSSVKSYLTETFRENFSPLVFAVEEERVSFDATTNRLSVSTQFVYQKEGGSDAAVVEIAQSVAYREQRTIDYTPVHSGGAYAAEADVGWATLERVWSRTVIVIGEETPKKRLIEQAEDGLSGKFSDPIAGIAGPDSYDTTKVVDGWNVVASTSQLTPSWIGDASNGERIAMSTLSETVIERYHEKPTRGASGIMTPR